MSQPSCCDCCINYLISKRSVVSSQPGCFRLGRGHVKSILSLVCANVSASFDESPLFSLIIYASVSILKRLQVESECVIRDICAVPFLIQLSTSNLEDEVLQNASRSPDILICRKASLCLRSFGNLFQSRQFLIMKLICFILSIYLLVSSSISILHPKSGVSPLNHHITPLATDYLYWKLTVVFYKWCPRDFECAFITLIFVLSWGIAYSWILGLSVDEWVPIIVLKKVMDAYRTKESHTKALRSYDGRKFWRTIFSRLTFRPLLLLRMSMSHGREVCLF